MYVYTIYLIFRGIKSLCKKYTFATVGGDDGTIVPIARQKLSSKMAYSPKAQNTLFGI